MQKLRFISPTDPKQLLLRRLRSEPVAVSHPALVKRQWNPINEPGAEYFGAGSSKYAYWTCVNGHKIYRPICGITRAYDHRSKFGGCSVCSGRQPAEIVSLEVAYPAIAADWRTKENGCPARNINARSRRHAEWQCSENHNHVYKTKVCARTKVEHGQGCPSCYDGPTVDLREWPDARKLYICTKRNRGFTLRKLPISFSVFWRCDLNPSHEWYESFATLKARNFECKKCHAANSKTLANFPELVAQIHPSENGVIDSSKILHGSHQVLTWCCTQGPDHVWKARVYNRTIKGAGCPCCANRQVSITNCLGRVMPSVAKDLHPSLNGSDTPESIIAASTKLCWWRCQYCNHDWQAQVRTRTVGKRCCPNCKARPTDDVVVPSPRPIENELSHAVLSGTNEAKIFESVSVQMSADISAGDMLTSVHREIGPVSRASVSPKENRHFSYCTHHHGAMPVASVATPLRIWSYGYLARAP